LFLQIVSRAQLFPASFFRNSAHTTNSENFSENGQKEFKDLRGLIGHQERSKCAVREADSERRDRFDDFSRGHHGNGVVWNIHVEGRVHLVI
jgi:hypothetical protein